MPVPVELLRFLDRAAPAAALTQPSTDAAQDKGEDALPPVPAAPVLTTPARLPTPP